MTTEMFEKMSPSQIIASCNQQDDKEIWRNAVDFLTYRQELPELSSEELITLAIKSALDDEFLFYLKRHPGRLGVSELAKLAKFHPNPWFRNAIANMAVEKVSGKDQILQLALDCDHPVTWSKLFDDSFDDSITRNLIQSNFDKISMTNRGRSYLKAFKFSPIAVPCPVN
jgi:hypothetical protein